MKVTRSDIRLKANPRRVIPMYFQLGNVDRVKRVVNRIMTLSDIDIVEQLESVFEKFEHRHKNFSRVLIDNFYRTEKLINIDISCSDDKKLLIGSYFTNEYSIQSAALFNPSIVSHFDQSDSNDIELKFILSLRATGERHISSIEFREGKVSSEGEVHLAKESDIAVTASKYERKEYTLNFLKTCLTDASIAELDLVNKLPEKFNIIELNKYKVDGQEYNNIDELIDSNYECLFHEDLDLSERVLFPLSNSESMGMEDARFVRFTDDNGELTYYATYTAFNDRKIQTKLITTKDFLKFKISTPCGSAVQNKGFAIFPRKIEGKYCITSRLDSENMFIMFSDDMHVWDNSQILQIPEEPWEFIQLGNCGSPLETKEGWLLLTHAVGPMRRYVISAMLLDLKDPSKVIKKMKEPLLEPNEDEREGYVPNVVYSCGSIIHKKNLIIPYAMSDTTCGFAKVTLDELLNNMN
ncbi:glycoside hydrolase family 130 protein [Bacteroidota bacterium]